MSIRKQSKVNYFRLNWSERSEEFKQKQTDKLQELDQPFTLDVFVLLVTSRKPKENENGLKYMIQLIKDEKENGTSGYEGTTNYNNPALHPLFKYLRQSQKTVELFQLWNQYEDKPDLYKDVFVALLELFSMTLVINDDPSLSKVNKHISETITEKKLATLIENINNYNSSDNLQMTINTYRIFTALTQSSLKLAKYIQSKFPFSNNSFEKAMTDISSLGAYHGTRPFTLRFILSFLRHRNFKLTKFIVDSKHLLVKFFQKINYDHHYVVLDLVEALDQHILQTQILTHNERLKFFNKNFLSRLSISFAKDDMPDDTRDSIAKFLTLLCTSSQYGIAPIDPRWHYFRSDQELSPESALIYNIIGSLNPAKYQQHHTLYTKIMHSCPDLFFKVDYVSPTLSMTWFNRTTMLVKTLMSTIPRPPRRNQLLLSGGIPDSPHTLIAMLIPSHLSNFEFDHKLSQFVAYNQSILYQLCLRRVNTVMTELTHWSTGGAVPGLDLEVFIQDLKQGLKERMLSLNYFKENVKLFKTSELLYGQYIGILSEYTKTIGVQEHLPLRIFDYSLLSKSDALIQRQFIQIISNSKTFQIPSQLFTNLNESNESIIVMILNLYLNSDNLELKQMYHNLLFKLLSINNFYAGLEHEIDIWIENLSDSESAKFFVRLLVDTNTFKFQYIDVCQRVSTSLFGSSKILVSPVMVAALSCWISQDANETMMMVDNVNNYLSQVILSIGSNQSTAKTILSFFNLVHLKKQQPQSTIQQIIEEQQKPIYTSLSNQLTARMNKDFNSTTHLNAHANQIAFSTADNTIDLDQQSIIQSLSLLSIVDSKIQIKLLNDFDWQHNLINKIKQLQPRRIPILIPILLHQIETIKNEVAQQYLFDIVSLLFENLLVTKSSKAIQLAGEFLQSKYILTKWISSFQVAQLLLQLLQSQDSTALDICKVPIGMLIDQLVKDIKDKQFESDTFKSIELMVPYFDISICLDVALKLKLHTTNRLFISIIHVISEIKSYVSNEQLVKRLSNAQIDFTPLDCFISKSSLTPALKLKLSNTPQDEKTIQNQFYQLYQSILAEYNGNSSLELAILHLLLSSSANPIIFSFASFHSTFTPESIIKFIKNPTSVSLSIISTLSVVSIFEEKTIHQIVTASKSTSLVYVNWILLLNSLYQQNSQHLQQHTIHTIRDELFRSIEKFEIFSIKNTLTVGFIKLIVDLVRSICSKESEEFVKKQPESLQMILLTSAKLEQQTTNIKSKFASSLIDCLKKDNQPLLESFYLELLPFYAPLLKSEEKETIIKLTLKSGLNKLSLSLALVLAEYSRDNMAKSIHTLLMESSSQKFVWSNLKIWNESDVTKRNNPIRYLLARILYLVFLKNTDLCNNGEMLDHIFESYQATTHPVDQLLYRIIYLHQVNNPSLTEERIGRWGINYKESMSFNSLLIANTLFNEKLLEYTIQHYPVDAKAEMNVELKPIKLQNYQMECADKVFSYDPSFFLRLFKQLISTATQDSLNRSAFYTNGPLAFTLRSLSSNEKSIRKLAHNVIVKYIELIEPWKATSRTAKDQLRVLKLLKNSIGGNDQYIPTLYVLFLINAIKIFTKDSNIQPTLRHEILNYFHNTQKIDFTNSIPFMNNISTDLTVKYKSIQWIFDIINQSLPNQNTSNIIKKAIKLPELLSIFDNQSVKFKLKLKIIQILKGFAESGGESTLSKNGIIPWISNVLSNGSLPKKLFEPVLELLQSILSNLPNHSIDFQESSFISNYLLNYILSIEWTNEFISIISNGLKCISYSALNNSRNQTTLSITSEKIEKLLEKVKSVHTTNNTVSITLYELIVKVINANPIEALNINSKLNTECFLNSIVQIVIQSNNLTFNIINSNVSPIDKKVELINSQLDWILNLLLRNFNLSKVHFNSIVYQLLSGLGQMYINHQQTILKRLVNILVISSYYGMSNDKDYITIMNTLPHPTNDLKAHSNQETLNTYYCVLSSINKSFYKINN